MSIERRLPGLLRELAVLLAALSLTLVACDSDDVDGETEQPATPSPEAGTSPNEAGSTPLQPVTPPRRDEDGGGSPQAPTSDEDAGSSPLEGRPCTNDIACDDGDPCNGDEICVTVWNDPSRKVCAAGEMRCAPAACAANRLNCCDYRGGDADGDGERSRYCGGKDCNDDNPNISPGIEERCDAVDDDCRPESVGKLDADEDKHHSAACRNLDRDAHKWITGTDPDDKRKDINPDAMEVCDGVDNDCDAATDESGDGKSGTKRTTFYLDKDGDSFGDINARGDEKLQAWCDLAPLREDERLWSLQPTDCNDEASEEGRRINPNATELCNGIDDNCDGQVDEPPYDEKPDFTGTTLECGGERGWLITECPANADNCNTDVADGCETRLDSLCNCRACGQSCTFACGAGDCQEITSLASGSGHTCAITGEQGEIVSCWGANHRGQLGDDTTVPNAAAPRRVGGLSGVLQLSTGGDHSCVITRGEQAVFCWGENAQGQLGSSTSEERSGVPLQVSGYADRFLIDVVNISASHRHTCAVQRSGTLLCWGSGDGGRLGDAVDEPHDAPAPSVAYRAFADDATIDNARQVVTGFAHTCVLTTDGTVECTGSNLNGQLGDGLMVDQSTIFQPVPGLEAIDELVAGSYHTCARRGRELLCWGDNSLGQLGRAQSSGGVPTLVEGLEDALSVAAGNAWTCAIDAADDLYCWGSNISGELGDPTRPPDDVAHPVPGRVALGKAKRVFGGVGSHVCATTLDGRAYCWGQNSAGELGRGTVAPDGGSVPEPMLSLSGSVTCQKDEP